jgi:hypothetical protein
MGVVNIIHYDALSSLYHRSIAINSITAYAVSYQEQRCTAAHASSVEQ